MPDSDGEAHAAEIRRLTSLDLSALRRRLRALVGRPAPEHLTRSLLERVIAYRMQAQAYGDLSRESIRLLDRIAKSKGEADSPLPELRPVKPGTFLVREWQGVLQRVMVLEEGYAWNGTTYTSLSEVARAITGTPWNGPRFFGLRDRPKDKPKRKERTPPSQKGRAKPTPASRAGASS
jgi:hypothetical protein